MTELLTGALASHAGLVNDRVAQEQELAAMENSRMDSQLHLQNYLLHMVGDAWAVGAYLQFNE